ncbi:putative phosphatidylserine decarboxylase [Phaeomoniella chlamydospora]|uniref:Phosphatidylserine decarboxylase proenzyme 2 n=1 Tax=Phaeomoniella chlamydospora TaxID=158046 RepID=A0A0G2EF07_PHACM|nr:putative phosphatidylserine decarboxylase [Phaeomoniella chlamydospora]
MVRLGLPNRISSHLGGRSGQTSQQPSRATSPSRAGGDTNKQSLILKAYVIQARNLAPKDRGGTSDPYLVVTLGAARQSTPSISKTLNPEWKVCLDLPINGVPLVECVLWDKDRFGKDYMGEFDIAVEDIFANGRPTQEPKWYTLKSSRKGGKKRNAISGEVQIQFSIIDPTNPSASPEELLQKFNKTIVSADEDDELSRFSTNEDVDAEMEDDTSDETDDPTKPDSIEKRKRKRRLARLRRRSIAIRAYEFTGNSDVAGIIFAEVVKVTDLPPERNMTRTSFDMDPFVVTSLGRKVLRTKVIRHNLNPIYNEKMVFQLMKHESSYVISFTVMDRDKMSGNDMIATTNFPVQALIQAAPEADPNTGLYKLPPPADVSTQAPMKEKSRFKIPLSRSSSTNSLQKLTRPALRSRTSQTSLSSSSQLDFSVQEAPSNGQNAGPTSAPLSGSFDNNLLTPVPTNPETNNNGGLNVIEDTDLNTYVIPLTLKNKDRWEDKHSPEIHLRAKYLPYRALRQQFWRAMLRQYDTDESNHVSKIELTSMLDTLGSTLKESTIDGFFTRFASENQPRESMDLTFDQAVICLEEQLEIASQKKSLGQRFKNAFPDPRFGSYSMVSNTEASDSGVSTPLAEESDSPATNTDPDRTAVPAIDQKYLGETGAEGQHVEADDLADDNSGEEHVVEIRECPICHQPRLDKRTDADIITHIATCASQDWRQVNNFVMGGFVTSSQAQRKWYSKVITKISYGGYKLGANSANILVQDRTTGQINEERMSVYVRLGIRLLYKALGSREMEKKRIKKLLRNLSIKQGRKYDDPVSAREIQGFIKFHQLNMDEVLLPVEQFKNFNEFFYRALKPGARPCSAPDDSNIVVSPADCRSVVFNQMDDATRIWVKGRDYTVERLLGNAYPQDAARYRGGALGIFRLAPQDYHRFHVPVDGVMGTPKLIEGEYYTVNPMAIRSALDVYGENVRVIVPIDSVSHGRVMFICIGAMMVGSTVITRKPGENLKRAEELGYFKFGGSTVLSLFEPGRVQFDDDLIENSSGALETLIRVGMSIGHHPSVPPHKPDMRKNSANVTQEERQEAKRRIEGSLAP